MIYIHHETPIRGKTNVWLTPKKIIDALGPFDLDPCAAGTPRLWDTAKSHICEPDNGLAHQWQGLVWLNPPYGDEIGVWMERLKAHNNGIALVFSRTDTKWFQSAAETASCMLFVSGRIKFHRSDGSLPKTPAGAPSVFIAYGEEAKQRLLNSGMKGLYVEIKK